jgi:acetyltransferase-like isoleucine patch superfamily enzyme
MAYYSFDKLNDLGFKSIGTNVQISDKCSIYSAENISIGSNVRIDDFCILSAGPKGIEIGNYVHIACYVSLIGSELIKIGNYCGVSARCSVYSSSDDYSGEYLFGPTVDEKYKNVHHKSVIINNYSIIGANTIILPGVQILEGVAVGALSLVNKSLDEWSVYAGVPAKKIKVRSRQLLQFLK